MIKIIVIAIGIFVVRIALKMPPLNHREFSRLHTVSIKKYLRDIGPVIRGWGFINYRMTKRIIFYAVVVIILIGVVFLALILIRRHFCLTGRWYDRETCLTERSNNQAARGMRAYDEIRSQKIAETNSASQEFVADLDSFLDTQGEVIRLRCLNEAYEKTNGHNGLGLNLESEQYWRIFYVCAEKQNKDVADYLESLLKNLK